MRTQDIVTRFAPSPNGPLHVGHAFAAITAHDFAKSQGGLFRLRVEDIDGARSRTEHVDALLADLAWLGLKWDGDVVFQSQRLAHYAAAAQRLRNEGLLYRCFCSRGDIATNAQAIGPDGPIYPGTCRALSLDISEARSAEPHVWRLDVGAARARAGDLAWHDMRAGAVQATPEIFGDVVLVRKDAPASYHLAATLDDSRDAITHVVRGADLFAATHIHRLLQALLNLPTPQYFHHALVIDTAGAKLSKSRGSAALAALREAGIDGSQFADDLRKSKLPIGLSLAATYI